SRPASPWCAAPRRGRAGGEPMSKTVVVLGARNLGGAIIDHFLERGWSAAGVARSEDTLAQVRERGALAVPADASDPDSLRGALARAREEYGSLDAGVNAVSAFRAVAGGPFGGGEVAQADPEACTRDQPRAALADMGEVARAVSYLVDQGERAYTHELQVTPAGERWLP